MENKLLREIADWFVIAKAPDLKDKIFDAIRGIETGGELSENQKKLLAFICFSYSMNRGPSFFKDVEMLVEKIGVQKQFCNYATDWIAYKPKMT